MQCTLKRDTGFHFKLLVYYRQLACMSSTIVNIGHENKLPVLYVVAPVLNNTIKKHNMSNETLVISCAPWTIQGSAKKGR